MKISLNQRGMSLMEITVAGGLMMGTALMAIKMMDQMDSRERQIEKKGDVNEIYQNVRTQFLNKTVCSKNISRAFYYSNLQADLKGGFTSVLGATRSIAEEGNILHKKVQVYDINYTVKTVKSSSKHNWNREGIIELDMYFRTCNKGKSQCFKGGGSEGGKKTNDLKNNDLTGQVKNLFISEAHASDAATMLSKKLEINYVAQVNDAGRVVKIECDTSSNQIIDEAVARSQQQVCCLELKLMQSTHTSGTTKCGDSYSVQTHTENIDGGTMGGWAPPKPIIPGSLEVTVYGGGGGGGGGGGYWYDAPCSPPGQYGCGQNGTQNSFKYYYGLGGKAATPMTGTFPNVVSGVNSNCSFQSGLGGKGGPGIYGGFNKSPTVEGENGEDSWFNCDGQQIKSNGGLKGGIVEQFGSVGGDGEVSLIPGSIAGTGSKQSGNTTYQGNNGYKGGGGGGGIPNGNAITYDGTKGGAGLIIIKYKTEETTGNSCDDGSGRAGQGKG